MSKEKKVGLQGKRRESSQEIDVSQPYFYNLIKAAVNSLEIAEKNRLIVEKDKVIHGKDEQISILNQQIHIFKDAHTLVGKQAEELRQLQEAMKGQEAIIKEQNEQIAKSEREPQPSRQLSSGEIEQKVRVKLGDSVWRHLHPSSRRELCDAYRNYILIKSEQFTAQFADYSGAGHPLGTVAEREVVAPFFKGLYQFLSTDDQAIEVGGIMLKLRRRYTLGDLPALLSSQWDTFIDHVLEQEDCSLDKDSYRKVFCNGKINQNDRQRLQQFIQQWQHPLSKWLAKEQVAASTIDQIRKLRNIADHTDPMYLWQFRELWSLVVGWRTRRGLLQEIYDLTGGRERGRKDDDELHPFTHSSAKDRRCEMPAQI